jgi:hypothetical protein
VDKEEEWIRRTGGQGGGIDKAERCIRRRIDKVDKKKK